MNKYMAILLILVLALILTGCAQTPVTPIPVTQTQVQSSLSQTPSQVPVKREDVQSKTKESIVASQEAMEQDISQKNDVENQPVPFQSWTAQTRSQYAWEVNTPYHGEGINKLSCIALCNSQEELKSYLSENGQPQELAEQYPEEYFLQNSLFLFIGYEACRGDLWLVKEMQEEKDVLSVVFEYHPISIIDAIGFRLYHVEVQQKTNHIKSLESTIRYHQSSGNNQNGVPNTETSYWSVP